MRTDVRVLALGMILTLAASGGPVGPAAARAAPAGDSADSFQWNAEQEEREEQEDERRGGLSLEPERTISLDTSEGTWMNLDVSPDGSTIVFDLLGDIYTIPIDGGEATRLTSGMAYDIQPTFSPDGSEVAFVSDRSGSDNVWVMSADGSGARAVTREREDALNTPEWDPDGEYLLARKGGELWLYHVDGGSGMQMSESEMVGGLAGPVFSPDGRYIYFSSRGGGFGGGGLSFTAWQVRRLDRATGDVATITASPNGAFRPTISPDGRWLVYGCRLDAETGLRIRDLESDREEWLAWGLDRDLSERSGALDLMPAYDFTPDGSAVVIATGGTFHRIDLESKDDRPISFTARVEQELGPFVFFPWRYPEEPVKLRNLRYVNQDDAGSRIVFSALSKLWAMEPGGDRAEPFVLVEQGFGQFQPVLSPGGDQVVYVSWDDVAGGHVWRLPLEGPRAGQPVRLTEYAGYYLHPTWSPDGTRIAFMKEDAAAFRNIWSRNTGQIVWVEAAGGPQHYVATAPSDNRLTFSPDGARLTYVADVRGGRQAESEVVSVRLDGTDRRTIARIRAETYEAVPSPDNRWIAFSVREDILVAALPMAPEPPVIGERSGPGPVKRVTRDGGIDIHWEDGGETLTWTFGDTFHRIALADVFAEPEAEEAESPDDAAAADAAARGAAGAGQEPGEQEQEEEEPQVPEPERVRIDITVPRSRPEGTVALVGATVITMAADPTTGEPVAAGTSSADPTAPPRSAGPASPSAAGGPGTAAASGGGSAAPAIVEDATVLVEGNRIVAVGPAGEIEVPRGAERIDVAGKFIIPGFIDLHAHLRPPREVFVETSWSYLANLAYGVTTTRDVSTSNDSFAYGELVETGNAIGPRIYSTGRAMTTSNARIESLDDARAMVRHYKRLGTNVIKQYMQPHRRQRQWVIQAAREEGMNVTNEGGGDLRLDLTMVLDGYTGFEHSLPVGNLYDDVVQLVARSRTWYTPTLVVSYGGPTAEWYFYQTTEVHDDEKLSHFTPHDDLDRRTRRGQMNALDEYHFTNVARGAAAILQAGGNVALGAHGEQQGICAHWEIWALQMGGLSNFDALRTATTIAAHGLGLLDDLGTIEAGKLADLIVLDADPLAEIRNTNTIAYVMKNGELWEGDTLAMVWPERRPKPPIGFRALTLPPGLEIRR